MKSLTPFLGLLACVFVFFANPAVAQGSQLCEDPGPVGLPAGYAVSELSFDTRFGTRWACLVTPPGYGPAPTAFPVLVMLHGGNGSPQNLMENSKEVLLQGFAAHGGQGYVMIFPAGVPAPDCDMSALPCENNMWGNFDVNLPFLNLLLETAAALPNSDDSRIFLAGFSGGAKMIYQTIAAGGPDTPVLGIATMAGGLSDRFDIEDPVGEYLVVNVAGGAPVHAMIAQGQSDARLPFYGGFDDRGTKLVPSFDFKEAMFRLLTGTAASTGTVSVVGSREYTEWRGGTHRLLSIRGAALQHRWTDWLSADMFRFFDAL